MHSTIHHIGYTSTSNSISYALRRFPSDACALHRNPGMTIGISVYMTTSVSVLEGTSTGGSALPQLFFACEWLELELAGEASSGREMSLCTCGEGVR